MALTKELPGLQGLQSPSAEIRPLATKPIEKKKKKGIQFAEDTKESENMGAYPKTPNVLSRKADSLMSLAVIKDKTANEESDVIFKPRKMGSPTSTTSSTSSTSSTSTSTFSSSSTTSTSTSTSATYTSSIPPSSAFLPPTSTSVSRSNPNKNFSFVNVKSYEEPNKGSDGSLKLANNKNWDYETEDGTKSITPKAGKLERRYSASSLETMTPELKERLMRRTVDWKTTLEEKFDHHTPWFSARSLETKEKPIKGLLKKTQSKQEKQYFTRLQELKQDRLKKMTEGCSIFLIDQFLCKPHQRWFYLSDDGAELCWEKEWESKLHKKTGFKFPSKKKKRSLATVVRIVYGPFRKWMVGKNPNLAHCIPWLCFTLEFAPEYEDIRLPELLGFVCANEEQVDLWLTGLSEHSPVSRLTYFPHPRVLWRRMKIKLSHGPIRPNAYIPGKHKKNATMEKGTEKKEKEKTEN